MEWLVSAHTPYGLLHTIVTKKREPEPELIVMTSCGIEYYNATIKKMRY